MTLKRSSEMMLASIKKRMADSHSDYYFPPISLEEELREKHPSLKDAWEQYQTILKLAKAEYNAQGK